MRNYWMIWKIPDLTCWLKSESHILATVLLNHFKEKLKSLWYFVIQGLLLHNLKIKTKRKTDSQMPWDDWVVSVFKHHRLTLNNDFWNWMPSYRDVSPDTKEHYFKFVISNKYMFNSFISFNCPERTNNSLPPTCLRTK